MSAASVGDDVLGDDQTVIELQERVARMFGKEEALFVPSGTMSVSYTHLTLPTIYSV